MSHLSDAIKLNKGDWEEMPIRNMHTDHNLIRCQKRLFPVARNKKLLDIGFGEGQNLLYFLSEGFSCYGTEISKNRVHFVRGKLKKFNKKANIKLVDSHKLPFVENFFDVVVGWESLYYNDREGLVNALSEVWRVLKPHGHFLSSMVSTKDSLCQKEVAPSVFQPTTLSQAHCVIYGFKTKRQIKNAYKRFRDIDIGFYSSELFRDFNYHYVIHCLK